MFTRERFAAAQPQYPLTIDWAHPLARGLLFSCYNSSVDVRAPRDYVSGRLGTLVGTTQTLAKVVGPSNIQPIAAPTFNGSSDTLSFAINLSPYKKITVSCWVYWDSSQTAVDDAVILRYGGAAGSETGFSISPNWSASNTLVQVLTFTSSSTFSIHQFTRPTVRVWRHWVFMLDNTLASAQAAVGTFIDGVSQALTANTNTQAANVTFSNTNLNIMNRNGPIYSTGNISNVALWARHVNNGEVRELYMRPWAMFSPARQWRVSNALAAQVPSWFMVQ